MPRIITVTLLIALLIPTAANSQPAATTPEAARIAELEAEVTRLRAQLSLLEAGADAAANDVENAAADPKSLLAPAKPKSRDKPPRIRSAKSVVDLLERLSDEAAATRAGTWNAATEALAIDELSYSVWNTPYGANLTVKQVDVKPNPAATADPLASPYTVAIHFEPNTLKFREQNVVEAFEPLEFFADAALRRRVEKLSIGKGVAVRGRIKTVKVGGYGYSTGLAPRAQFQASPAFKVTVHFRELRVAGVM